jgi:hypothetical protein
MELKRKHKKNWRKPKIVTISVNQTLSNVAGADDGLGGNGS